MRRARFRSAGAILGVALIAGCGSAAQDAGSGIGSLGPPQSSEERLSGPIVLVTRVVDGDTIVVRDGGADVRVRLIGVDTPESVKPGTPVECFAIAASNFTKSRLTGVRVRLEYDVDRFDRYGRTLAYVWVGGALFNEDLVAEGYAAVETVPPDVRYADRFLAAQRDARLHDRGLWSACPTP